MPPVYSPDVLSAKMRRLEARQSILEDAVDMQPRRLPWIPELSLEQKRTIVLCFGFLVALSLSAIVHKQGAEQ